MNASCLCVCVRCRVLAELQVVFSGAAAAKGKALEPVLLGLVGDISPSTKKLYEHAQAMAASPAAGAGAVPCPPTPPTPMSTFAVLQSRPFGSLPCLPASPFGSLCHPSPLVDVRAGGTNGVVHVRALAPCHLVFCLRAGLCGCICALVVGWCCCCPRFAMYPQAGPPPHCPPGPTWLTGSCLRTSPGPPWPTNCSCWQRCGGRLLVQERGCLTARSRFRARVSVVVVCEVALLASLSLPGDPPPPHT